MAHTSSREELWDLIKDIRFAMFTTRHENGHMHSRPMTTQTSRLGADESLWFFMSRTSEPVGDLRRDPIVNVAYSDPGKDAYVSVSGVASLVEDVQRKRELWSKMDDAWFPGGPEDPDVALVRVTIEQAEYWNVRESKPVQLFRMVAAAASGTPPRMGEHANITMGPGA